MCLTHFGGQQVNRRGLGVDWGAASVGCFSGFGLNIWSLEETCSWFMSPTAQRIQGFIKTNNNNNKKLINIILFSGDSSCRVAFWWFSFWLFMFFVYLVKNNFLCWSRGHNSWWTYPSLTWVQLSFLVVRSPKSPKLLCKIPTTLTVEPSLFPDSIPSPSLWKACHTPNRKKQRFVLVKSNMVVVLVM